MSSRMPCNHPMSGCVPSLPSMSSAAIPSPLMPSVPPMVAMNGCDQWSAVWTTPPNPYQPFAYQPLSGQSAIGSQPMPSYVMNGFNNPWNAMSLMRPQMSPFLATNCAESHPLFGAMSALTAAASVPSLPSQRYPQSCDNNGSNGSQTQRNNTYNTSFDVLSSHSSHQKKLYSSHKNRESYERVDTNRDHKNRRKRDFSHKTSHQLSDKSRHKPNERISDRRDHCLSDKTSDAKPNKTGDKSSEPESKRKRYPKSRSREETPKASNEDNRHSSRVSKESTDRTQTSATEATDEVLPKAVVEWIRCSPSELFYECRRDNAESVSATKRLIDLQKRFRYELIERAERAVQSKPKFELPVRTVRLKAPKPVLSSDSSSCGESDSNDDDCEDTAYEELERKKRHPLRLHEELWFNDVGEMNDGPLCRCSQKARKTGIRHGIYPGEEHLEPCDPLANNRHRLHHYRIHITPDTNFATKFPTVIAHDGHEFVFEGYSLLSHWPLTDPIACKVIRFNIEYTVTFVAERFPANFAVEDLELFARFVFAETLELVDLNLKAHREGEDSCPRFHFLPRFGRPLDDNGKELLSMNVMNDGPLCRCSQKARKTGIRHGIYPGEEHLEPCDPLANNRHRLHHYRIHITPDTNFATKFPTVIAHDGHEFVFEGYSLLSHWPLTDPIACKVIRFNIEYTVTFVAERFPANFAVEDLELFARFVFAETLELVDLNLKAHREGEDSCPRFHFLPRFGRPLDDNGKELLSMNVVLQYLLANNELIIDEKRLDDYRR
ncbi:unnamed protein product, partial [Oppiella nova]